MTQKLRFVGLLMIVALMALTACDSIGQTSGQSSSDAQAVQQFFPTVSGYSSVSSQSITNAFSMVTGGASLATGNILGSVAINRINSMIDCYRDVGAAEAKVYTQLNFQQPVIGALAIVNQNRVASNFVSCATDGAIGGRSQSAQPQPCTGGGSFSKDNNQYLYIFVASDQALCTEFNAHFDQY